MNPSTPEDMLRIYSMAAALSADILAQARQEEWDTVIALGQQYIAAIEMLQAMEQTRALDAGERARKHALLIEILENDSATRALVEPGLARIGALLNNLRRQQNIIDAYGAPVVAVS
ncbi:MAG: flagellar protein FliT [Pigmentiphaga sp.]|nr:flagellar protein FliT [Pigmentiphaga sp.]